MHVNRLKENMNFKNYKELCKFLGINVLSGNSKQAQFTELARHCLYEKVGHQILIKEIYPSPISESASRGRKAVYSEILQSLVMDFLISLNLSETCMTRNSLLIKVGMVNESYVYDEKNIKQLHKELDFPQEIIFDFFNTTTKVFKNALEGVFKSLEHKGYIHFGTALMLAYRVNDNANNLYREATPQEVYNIRNLEKHVLNQFDYTSLKELNFSRSRSVKFSKHLIQLFNEQYAQQGEEIRFYYSAHRIIINEQINNEQRVQFLIKDPNEKEQLQKQLIQSLKEQLLKNATKRHVQALESNKTDFVTKARCSIQYIPAHKQLIARLINRTEGATKI